MTPAERLRAYPGLAGFEPRLDMLSLAQRRVWPHLGELPLEFVLYGGTAIALRLGHRQSLDFDLFAGRRFAPGDLVREVPLLRTAPVVRTAPDTLIVTLDRVRVSLFGVAIGAIASPEVTPDIGLAVASLADLAATKAKTLLDRAEAKDYLDLDALLRTGLPLADILGYARAVFGQLLDPLLVLKAVTYFEDEEVRDLPEDVKARLRRSAAGVRSIPSIEAPLPGPLPAGVPIFEA